MMELAASQPRSRHDPFIAGQIMSPSHLFEPTYHAIKLRLMTGAWRAGFRLEPVKISAELGVGVSPIRDCLNRLTGERLIEAQSGEGFHVPLIQPQTLRELLDLNQTLLLTAILSSRPSMLAPLPPMSIMQHGLPASSITSDRRTTIWSFWSLSTTSATASTHCAGLKRQRCHKLIVISMRSRQNLRSAPRYMTSENSSDISTNVGAMRRIA
jgi:hypothetical protein